MQMPRDVGDYLSLSPLRQQWHKAWVFSWRELLVKGSQTILFASTRKPDTNRLKGQRNSLAPVTRRPDRRQILSCLHPQTPFPCGSLSSVPPRGSAPSSGWQWTGGSNSMNTIIRGEKKRKLQEALIPKNMGDAHSIPLLPPRWQEFSPAQSRAGGRGLIFSQSSVWKAWSRNAR